MAGSAELAIQIAAINRASAEMKKIAGDIRGISTASTQTATGVNRLSAAMGGTVSQIGKFAAGFVAAQVSMRAFSGAISGTIGAAISFESSFAGVRKTVDATEAEFKQLETANRDMAKSLPLSVDGLNDITALAGQLGVRGVGNLTKFTRTIADLGITTNLSTEEAAQSFAQIANVVGLPISDVDRLGAAIVDLGNKSATTERDIVEFVQRIAGAGKIAGLTAADLAGIGAAMASVGVEAEAGGTAIQKVLISIRKAAVEGGKELDVFAATAGMTATEFQNLAKTDGAEAFTRFVEGLGKAGDDAFKILEQLGLEDQRLIRSFLSLAGAGDLARRSIETGNAAFRQNTALVAEAQKRYATTASQIKIAQNNFRDLGITLGRAVLPAIVTVSQAAVDAIPYIEGMMRAGIDGSKVFAQLLGDVSVALQGLIDKTKQLTIAVGILGVAFAVAFPAQAVFIGIAAAIAAIAIQIGILTNDTRTASDVTLEFENAWYRAEIGILGVIHDIENAILTAIIAPINAAIDAVNALGNAGDFLGITIKDIPKVGTEVLGRTAPQKAIDEVERRIAENRAELERRNRLSFDQRSFQNEVRRLSRQGAAASTVPQITIPDFTGGGGGGGGGGGRGLGGIISLADAIALGLSDAEVAALELAEAQKGLAEERFRERVGLQALALAFPGVDAAGVKFRLGLAAIADHIRKTGQTIQQFIYDVSTTALEGFKSAFNAIFNQPTRESLELDTRKAELELKRALLLRTRPEDDPRVEAIDKQIDAIDSEVNIRQLEMDVMQKQMQLRDRTLQTDLELMGQAALLATAIEKTSTEVKKMEPIAFYQTMAMLNAGNAANGLADSLRGLGGAIGSIPGKASGGYASGLTLVGERGPELVRLPGGSYVYPNNRLSEAGASGGNTAYITINSTGSQDAASADRLAKSVIRILRDELGMQTLAGPRLPAGAFSPRRA